MKTRFFFSPSRLSFYPAALKARYVEAGDWPDDVLPVTDDQYQMFRADGTPSGMRLSADSAGQPVWTDAPALPPVPVSERRQDAFDWLDATADRIRAADRSVGQYLDAEYQVVAEALVAYRNDPDGEVPEAVQSYADAEGLSVAAAAEQIAEAAARAVELLQSVRRIRLAGKAAVRDAGDEADMQDVARPFIDRLETLASD